MSVIKLHRLTKGNKIDGIFFFKLKGFSIQNMYSMYDLVRVGRKEESTNKCWTEIYKKTNAMNKTTN